MPLDTARFLFVFEQMPVLEFVPGRPLKDWRDGDLAAALGHTYVLENQPALEFTNAALHGAVAGGHTAAVRWLLAREDATSDSRWTARCWMRPSGESIWRY